MSNNAYLAAASVRLRRAIFAFRAKQVVTPFHADELSAFVTQQVGVCAPGSADRVLRDMRQAGLLNYQVINRKKSLYRFLPRSGT